MQYKIFSIPSSGDVGREEDMNLFLRQHRIVNVAREVTNVNGSSFWTFCIEYLGGGTPKSSFASTSDDKNKNSKIDYREVLSPEDFIVYAALREWRKSTSLQDSVPVYTICTNEQLAFFARARPNSRAELLKNPGFGEGKAERYGEGILAVVQKNANAKTTVQNERETTCDESAD